MRLQISTSVLVSVLIGSFKGKRCRGGTFVCLCQVIKKIGFGKTLTQEFICYDQDHPAMVCLPLTNIVGFIHFTTDMIF